MEQSTMTPAQKIAHMIALAKAKAQQAREEREIQSSDARSAVNSSPINNATPATTEQPTQSVGDALRARIAALQAANNAKRASGLTQHNAEQLNAYTKAPPHNPLKLAHGQIQYNPEQLRAIELISTGQSCVVTGSAGTGKTTIQSAGITALIQSGKIGKLQSGGHKFLIDDTPGVVIVAFTRRAVVNIRKRLPADLKNNCMTLHKLLQYQRKEVSITDPDGNTKTSKPFVPTRNAANPLPSSINCMVFEESGMLGTDLYEKYREAIKHPVQEVFLGDIQQLPPVFGPAILGFKMLELPTVELHEVHRQALGSPIIKLATQIINGEEIKKDTYNEFPQMQINVWGKQLSVDWAIRATAQYFIKLYNSKMYDPTSDIILMAYNKSYGTLELNKHIAEYFAVTEQKLVHEVIAGYNKYYFAIGDKVLVDKEDAYIVDIKVNGNYTGIAYQDAAHTLNYWGGHRDGAQSTQNSIHHIPNTLADVDTILANMQLSLDDDGEERKQSSSHIIVVRMCESEEEVELTTAAEVNSLLLGYAITCHKAQGSEWDKVFICLHNSNSRMVSREWLYTAVTRARTTLAILCEPEHLIDGVARQVIKGDTLTEKAEYFKGKQRTALPSDL